MNKNERLYSLIKSLSQAEKRYFKVFVGSEGKNYLKLFNFIDSQPFFSDEEIKMEFAGEKFVKQLHVTKNYLNKLILKSLRNFHSSGSIETSLNEMLKDVEILFRKELYDQCREITNKIIERASTHEKYPQLLLALDWKRKLLVRTSAPFKIHETQNEIIGESIETANKIIAENKYWYLTFDSFGFFTGKYQNVDEYMENELLSDQVHAPSLRAKILFHHLRYTMFQRKNDLQKAVNEIDQLIKILEENPERLTEDPSSYITAVNNKITLLLSNRMYKDIPALLEKVREVPQKFNVDEKSKITVRSIIRTFNIELEMYRDTGNYQAGYEKIELINEYIESHTELISPDYLILLYYQFAYFAFMLKKYKESMRRTNQIINSSFGLVREDIQTYTRFLNMILHLELNNTYVLRYAVDSTRRFLQKKRKLENWEKVLLRFFSKASLSLPEKHHELFIKLKKDLFAKTEPRKKANVLDYLDFEGWINSKMNEHS